VKQEPEAQLLRLPAITATMEGLRDAIFDEINGLRTGTTTPSRARAVSQLAARVIDSLRLQVQHQRLILDFAKHDTPLGSKKPPKRGRGKAKGLVAAPANGAVLDVQSESRP
jgi:hypothetical protein